MLNWVLFVLLIPLGITIAGSIIVELFRRLKKDQRITCEALSFRRYNEKESSNVKISLSYKNEKVGDSIIVTTARLINTGKKDISFEQVFEDRIEIVLKSAKIIDVIIEKESEKVASKVEKVTEEDDRWFLSWSILKKNEIIELKIVAVDQNGEDAKDINNINSIADNLSFVFRGNNIDKIEFVTPSVTRYLRFCSLIGCIMGFCLLFALPTDVDVRYDVLVDGIRYENVRIRYNDYTREYYIRGKDCSIYTSHIDRLRVSEQPRIAIDQVGAIVAIFITIVYLWTFIMIKRKPKSRLVQSLFFMVAHK